MTGEGDLPPRTREAEGGFCNTLLACDLTQADGVATLGDSDGM
jgi:hypothetical protein